MAGSSQRKLARSAARAWKARSKVSQDRQRREAAVRLVLGTPVFCALIVAALVLVGVGMNRGTAVSQQVVEVVRPGGLLPSVARPAAAVPSTPIELGQQLYRQTCAVCHGADARGGIGKNLVTSAFLHGLTDQQAVDFITVGRGIDDPANTTRIVMPPRGGNNALDDEQLQAIVIYLRSIAQ